MINGIVFCLGIVLMITECVCWYSAGSDNEIDGIGWFVLIALRIVGTTLVVFPLLNEFNLL